MKYPEISVVVPCYKEAAVIGENILTLSRYLQEHFEHYEIIVVTDGSPDGTTDRVRALGESHPEIPLTLIAFKQNRGKGAAVKEGMLASRYALGMFLDADLTIPIEELEKFLPAIEHADIAIASRLVPGAVFEEKAPWYRTVLARGFHLLQIMVLGNFDYSDTQCGFKLFTRKAVDELFPRLTIKRFAFDAELLFLAKRMNLSVATLPVTIKPDPRNTNVDTLRDPLNMFFALLKIRFNYWFDYYKLGKS